ncbi:hypothetical protein B0H16DRAFT_1736795 [Mycena metata]|uniref:Uncharacterized protein n=1 Tax=Mycena metata TaxID=1033252 RepID=A0AAD7HMP4_9AGAR|nr:hypothetical protein B0H16DRAFT_1736795 [Mycena metata]
MSQDITCTSNEARAPAVFEAFGCALELGMNSVAFFISPAVPIYDGLELKDNANEIFAHFLRSLQLDGAAGRQKVSIPGNSHLGICPSTAYTWNKQLSTIDPQYLDIAAPGIHCILLPLSFKRLLDDASAELPDAKKQHLPPSTSNDSDIADESTRVRIMKKASRLVDAVSRTSWNPLSNPSTTTAIPILNLHRHETSNPNWSYEPETVDGVPCFQYKGRSFLEATLLPLIEQEYRRDESTTRIGVFGTQGSGKCHALMAASAVLLSKHVPVVVLTLSGTRPSVIDLRDALLLAVVGAEDPMLADNRDFITQIFDACCGTNTPEKEGNLGKLFRKLAAESLRVKLVFAVLGLDSLSKVDQDYVLNFTRGHIVCFIAQGNSLLRTAVEEYIAEGKQGYKAVYLNGGLEEDEYRGWLHQHEADIGFAFTSSESHFLVARTGNVPALLSRVFQAMKHDVGCIGLEEKHLKFGLGLDKIISAHVRKILKENPECGDDLRLLLLALLHNDTVDVSPVLVHQNYMYQDKDHRWRTTNSLTFAAVLSSLLVLGNWVRFFDVRKWVGCMSVIRSNPSMVGYAVEYGVTAALGSGVETKDLSIPADLPIFAVPKGGRPPESIGPGIYVPVDFNHRYIDCVVVWLKGKSISIAPMQITSPVSYINAL